MRATVRNPGDEARLAVLKALPGAAERLSFWQADLLVPGSFDKAIDGASYIQFSIEAGHATHPARLSISNLAASPPKKQMQAPPTSSTPPRPSHWRWCRTRRTSW